MVLEIKQPACFEAVPTVISANDLNPSQSEPGIMLSRSSAANRKA